MNEKTWLPEIIQRVKETDIVIHHGDILELTVDALICPTDSDLSMHVGLPAVIRDKEGFDLKDRILRSNRSLSLGDFVTLETVRLSAKQVIFVSLFTLSDPVIRKEIVERSMKAILRETEIKGLSSLAIPMLGSPLARASYTLFAQVIIHDVLQYIHQRQNTFKKIVFSLYNKESFSAFREHFFYLGQKYFS